MRHLDVAAEFLDGFGGLAAADHGDGAAGSHCFRHAARPLAEGGLLEPSDRAVPDHRGGRLDLLAVQGQRLGADVHTLEARGDGALSNLRDAQVVRLGGERVNGQGDLLTHKWQEVFRSGHFFVRDFGGAHIDALRLQEGISHLAADEQMIDLAQKCVDEGDLVGNLRSTHDAQQRPFRRRHQPIDDRQFLLDQKTDHAWLAGHRRRHGDHRGVLVVLTRAEGVVDVHVAQRRDCPGELGIVLLLARVESQVFEHQRAAGRQCSRGSGDLRTDDCIGGFLDRPTQQFAKPGGDLVHLQEHVLGRVAARTAEMAHGNHRGARVEKELDRRQRPPDAPIVRNRPRLFVERQIEVDADQDALVLEVGRREVVQRFLSHRCLTSLSQS